MVGILLLCGIKPCFRSVELALNTFQSLTAFLFLIFAAPVLSQSPTRDEKIQNIFDLRSRMTALEKEVLQPDSRDVSVAKRLGLEAIRLLPREKYDRVIAINGGGAYYSFAQKTHEYGQGSDIELQQGNLSVGFAGADYGFLIDLGDVNLLDVNK